MNTMNRNRPRRAPFAWLVLAAGLASAGVPARADPPTDVALGDCVARAERYFGTRATDFRVRDADTFRMASGRQVLALDLALGHGVNPRFHCVLDADGRIAQVRSTPRLPGRGEALLVAK
jgi:hypothetical protein